MTIIDKDNLSVALESLLWVHQLDVSQRDPSDARLLEIINSLKRDLSHDQVRDLLGKVRALPVDPKDAAKGAEEPDYKALVLAIRHVLLIKDFLRVHEVNDLPDVVENLQIKYNDALARIATLEQENKSIIAGIGARCP